MAEDSPCRRTPSTMPLGPFHGVGVYSIPLLGAAISPTVIPGDAKHRTRITMSNYYPLNQPGVAGKGKIQPGGRQDA